MRKDTGTCGISLVNCEGERKKERLGNDLIFSPLDYVLMAEKLKVLFLYEQRKVRGK
jgi:hypothetical protein